MLEVDEGHLELRAILDCFSSLFHLHGLVMQGRTRYIQMTRMKFVYQVVVKDMVWIVLFLPSSKKSCGYLAMTRLLLM